MDDAVSNFPGNFLTYRHAGRHWLLLSDLNKVTLYSPYERWRWEGYACFEGVEDQVADPTSITGNLAWRLLTRHGGSRYARALQNVINRAVAELPRGSSELQDGWAQLGCIFKFFFPFPTFPELEK